MNSNLLFTLCMRVCICLCVCVCEVKMCKCVLTSLLLVSYAEKRQYRSIDSKWSRLVNLAFRTFQVSFIEENRY